MRERRPMTLAEALIGLGLLAILLTSLSGLLYQVYTAERRLLPLRQLAQERFLVEQKLASALQSAYLPAVSSLEGGVQEEGTEGFYTDAKGRELFFSTRPSLQKDPHFCVRVQCHLYLDHDGVLWLETRPSPLLWAEEEALVRKEKLLQGVEDLHFAFYNLSKVKGSGGGPPQGEGAVWQRSWQKLPAMMKVCWRQRQEEIEMAFFFDQESLTHLFE